MTALTQTDLADDVRAAVERARAPSGGPAGRRPAGGRASCAPTSRWTPRTCCCASSSASSAPSDLEQAARWIRSQQRADGTWANFEGGPADLSTTIEAYAALRLAGDDPDDAAPRGRPASSCWPTAASRPAGCSPASGWRCSASGPGTTCRRCRPSWCCCRSGSRSTSTTGPAGPGRPSCRSPSWPPCARCGRCRSRLAELRTGVRPPPGQDRVRSRPRFNLLDRVLKAYDRLPRASRPHAPRSGASAEWIMARQEADGGWGGIQPPWVYSILALHLLGYPLEHPVLVGGDQRTGRLPGPRADSRRCRSAVSRPASRRCGTPASP